LAARAGGRYNLPAGSAGTFHQRSDTTVNMRAFPRRQVHLDFHTGPIPGVGGDFDARDFARTMKAAHVNSVTVFAKCHHGHLYYNTARPERHPGLKPGLDLLGEQVEALHSAGIRAPIYISIQCDEYAANTHPEWVARNPDSSQVKWAWNQPDKVFGAGWQILDMSTGYQQFLVEQTREILRRFRPVDGIFFDMCWDQPSTTQPFIDQMRAAGLDPQKDQDRSSYANRLAHAYMRRLFDMVKRSSRNATVYFNGRKHSQLAAERVYQTQAEIEALPTGGWGYMFFPKNVRFARQFGIPYMGMTARFHKSWADFGGLKPYAALEYETSQMMAHGAACSIGDQLHPRGVLDKAAYQLIGQAYMRVAEREPWLAGAKPITDVGLMQVPTSTRQTSQSLSGSDEGATRLLTQLRMQFDVVTADSDLDRYALIVLPDVIPVDADLARRLAKYVKGGGRILASGLSGLSADGSAVTLPILPIRAHGLADFVQTYIRFGAQVGQGVAPTDHIMYERGIRVTPKSGGRSVARVVEPYFQRAWDHFSSHNQTPPDRPSRYAAAVLGKGVAYIAYPVFSAFATHGNVPYRQLVGNLIAKLLPDPLIRVDGPSGLEVALSRQARTSDHPARSIVHLLYYTPERRARDLDLVEDIVPLHDLTVSLRCAKGPRRVYTAPDDVELPFEHADGRVNVCVPTVAGHAMVVLDEG
jgi:hypothetical protein